MSLRYAVVGFCAALFGVVLIVWPRRVARARNSGAANPEPTTGLVRLTRYVGGPLLVGLGLFLTASSL
ncbi:hypothetical protein C471_02410 [Halorubrum saccharovorum DSM 1137]|uniref:DUF6199 domain-containing protein n=1 Tax=Halorubrum saccharovorum DSM 1137 TaxID=1227484 RepID=M0E6Y2_9EURY|nr:hypothetical protein [Halorubrum saccharovorum]ELZ42808.1 hypothetical protein C471_02410 [Halorubrum saccharovorum DSM 1137]